MLNLDLDEWISVYHQTVHSGLGMSPLDKRIHDKGEGLKHLDGVKDIDAFFRMEENKTIYSNGCIRLKGRDQRNIQIPLSALLRYFRIAGTVLQPARLSSVTVAGFLLIIFIW